MKRVFANSSAEAAAPVFRALRAKTGMGSAGSLPPFVASLNSLLCPAVIFGSLVLCVAASGASFSGYYLALGVFVFLVSSQVFDDVDLFLPWHIHELLRVTRSVVASWAAAVGIVLFLGYATRMTQHFDHEVILTWVAVTPVLLLICIKLARVGVRRVIDTGAATRNAVIVGANSLGRTFSERLIENPYFSVRLHGFFDDRSRARAGCSAEGVLGTVAQVPDYVRRNRISSVYISLPMAAQPRIVRLIEELRDTTASVYFLPDVFVFDLVHARFDFLSGLPVVAIRETPFHGVDAVLKRAMDVTVAATIVTLVAPVMLAVAIAIKLSSPGPILFRQRRYGIDGAEIVVLKFRTMTVAEDGERVTQARREDPRITRLGAILRRTSLDELPQFFNVLAGSMSVVGPRPHAVAHNEEYRKLIPGYMLRHKVKPGITGWAQIHGFRGETDTVEKMQRRIDFDLEYLNNWSPSIDLWIILKTATCAWNARNAY